ncbi:MAG: 16S rRNA (cytosine1402-N4)-methyltransferase, partial [Candidatus Omnitrophota bacterium]
TYKHEGPLDLRLNPKRGQSAAEFIRTQDGDQLEYLFRKNSDEPRAKRIAAGIFNNKDTIHTTTDLSELIAQTLDNKPVADCTKATVTSIRRVFQALRIAVNDEFTVLEQFLQNLPFCLKPKGCVAILSFHSGEDRLVKGYFKEGLREGYYSTIADEIIRPSAAEQYANPRSSSAILRWAIKK